MKISYNWLSQYINPIPSPEETAQLLTDTGLEVESLSLFESIRGSLEGLVSGKVIECTKHPQADRLSLTKVDCGEEQLRQIVCGAPNVALGQYVIVALPGTTLYPDAAEPFTIKESKIRGELSQGMICAEDEIGLGHSHEGIIVLKEPVSPGTPAADIFKVSKDYVFEIGLTPNRIDAASHFGVARDLFTALYLKNGYELMKPEINISFSSETEPPVSVRVEQPDALDRYSGICIENIAVAESPQWLQTYLRAIGLKPINNVVDVTNFVLHETGQPLHSFDLDKISTGKVIVKTFPENIPFVTLDGVERKLQPSDLIISNGENEPMCIAGVFGGLLSGVSAQTNRIFLESARFNPTWIRKTARFHNLSTDSSFRFERGSDPESTVFALRRAVALITEITGGRIAGKLIDWYPNPRKWISFFYPWHKLDRLTGHSIPREDVREILQRLEIKIISENPDGLELSIPPFKVDVTQEQDVTEEILRIYGYNRIPIPEKVCSSFPSIEKPDTWKLKNHLSDHLASIGFSEILNNSLTSGEMAGWTSGQAVQLLNPLSNELNVLRNSALFGLCETISWNRNRQQPDLSVFEWGKTYETISGKYIETSFLALACSGNTSQRNWNREQQKGGYFYLKGVVEHCLALLGIAVPDTHFYPAEHKLLAESVTVAYNGKVLGSMGRVAERLAAKFDFDEDVWVAELNWEQMFSFYKKHRISYQEVSRYPSVKRDLSLLLNEDITFDALKQSARQSERKLLQDVQLFDVYAGKNLPSGKKSYALSFTFLDTGKTLTDEQINKAMQRIMQGYSQQFGVELRS